MRSVFLAFMLVASSNTVLASEIEGKAKPVDGDSFDIEIRIFGIDAPESGQTCLDANGVEFACGRIADEAMAAMLNGTVVQCEKQDQDEKYGRPVAICIADGVDVGAEMVDRGLAVAYREYSNKYVANEERARAAKRGLWAGQFVMPWDYRRGRRLQAPAASLTSRANGACPPPLVRQTPDCQIKGNIGDKGKKIYHLPGSRSYAGTKINKPGERYFCSEAEAVACGWSKPLIK